MEIIEIILLVSVNGKKNYALIVLIIQWRWLNQDLLTIKKLAIEVMIITSLIIANTSKGLCVSNNSCRSWMKRG